MEVEVGEQHGGPLLPVVQCAKSRRLRVERVLPTAAEVLVEEDEQVTPTRIIAHVASGARRQVRIVDVAGTLNLSERDVSSAMVKKRGEKIQAGELLAARRSFLPFAYHACRSPVDGRLVAVSYGWAVIEIAAEELSIPALVGGRVAGVVPGRSVIIETDAACIEGACGIAGEAYGVIRLLGKSSSDYLVPEQLPKDAVDAILVTDVAVSCKTLERAAEIGVKGLIAAGIPVMPPKATMLPVMATEGYGGRRMASERLRLLRELDGCHGALIVPPRDMPLWMRRRPALIVTEPQHMHAGGNLEGDEQVRRPVSKGDRVRSVRAPMADRWGRISGENWDRQIETPSGLTAAGVEVHFSTGATAWLPWLNLERVL